MDDVQNYIRLNKKLIQTMVIKSSLQADLINEEIRLKYSQVYIDPNDLSTWKYYRNLAGIPHELNEPIRVISFDTQEEILFSAATLATHKRTKLNYEIGTKNYYTLVNRYPDEESYIIGSLYPVDMYSAIASKDLTILRYDETLVEPQEISLIYELQSYIYNYDARWNVKSFTSSDELYPAAQYGIFTLNLLAHLVNLRFNKCFTTEAHSFHIKQHLASHFGLDRYMNYMILEQVLYLYKNIRYIERNIGKTDTFKTLVKKVIELRRLVPLYEISMKQKHQVNDKLLPYIYGKRDSITSLPDISDIDTYTIDELENLIRERTVDNPWLIDNHKETFRHKLTSSSSNNLETKYLVSDMTDFTDMHPYTIHESLMKHWLSMSNTNRYSTYVRFDNTLDDNEYQLHVTEALLYFMYILRSYYKIEDDSIPELLNSKRLKYVRPRLQELLDLLPIEDRTKLTYVAMELIDRFPIIDPVINVSDFYELCLSIQKYAEWQWFLVSNTHDVDSRAYVKAMANYMFVDENIIIDTEYVSMTEFILSKGLPEYADQPLKVESLLVNIYLAVTGYVQNDFNSARFIQKMLTEALLVLSSYSIDIIKTINDSRVVLSDWASIRIGNETVEGISEDHISPYIDVIDVNTKASNRFNYDLNKVEYAYAITSVSNTSNYEIINADAEPTTVSTYSVYQTTANAHIVNEWSEHLAVLTEQQIESIPTV